MRTLFIVILAYLSLSVQFRNELRSVFGVRVSYQANGQMLTFIAYFTDDVTESHRKILSFDEFVHFASGDWPSIYNRNRMNLFDLNSVTGGVYQDSITFKKTSYCFAIDSLWKLRFSHYPFLGNNDTGWSQSEFLPSLPQQKYLYDEYGMTHIDTRYFVDTSFWKLLRDVTDKEWIERYKNIPLTN